MLLNDNFPQGINKVFLILSLDSQLRQFPIQVFLDEGALHQSVEKKNPQG